MGGKFGWRIDLKLKGNISRNSEIYLKGKLILTIIFVIYTNKQSKL